MLSVNGNIKTPDMYSTNGLIATDPVTLAQTAKLSGSGTIQGINSHIVVTSSKTKFNVVVDTVTVKETVIANDTPLVEEGAIEQAET
jgi:hypothetical protein